MHRRVGVQHLATPVDDRRGLVVGLRLGRACHQQRQTRSHEHPRPAEATV